MILQITREVNGQEEEQLIDGVSDVVTTKDNLTYVEKDKTFQKIIFDDSWKEENRMMNIYLLNDEGKTIKRIYNK